MCRVALVTIHRIAAIHVLLLQYVVDLLLVGEAHFIMLQILIVSDISICNPLVVLCCGARTPLVRVMQQVLAALLVATL